MVTVGVTWLKTLSRCITFTSPAGVSGRAVGVKRVLSVGLLGSLEQLAFVEGVTDAHGEDHGGILRAAKLSIFG